MRRVLVPAVVLGVIAALAWWFVWPAFAAKREPIRLGLLHSLTGPMAISELSMRDAEILAVEELNAAGGLLGRRVVAVEADGRSDASTFAREAERLIREQKVSAVIGCWSSDCRKSVKEVVEKDDHLLIYPVMYEGMEQSPNVVYTGAAPNQQVMPTIKWFADTMHVRRFYLLGTDSLWSRGVSAVVKDQIRALSGELAGEEYLEAGTSDVAEAVSKALAAKPAMLILTVEGVTNVPLYRKLRGEGGAPADMPILSFPLTEDELRSLPTASMTNDYLTCNYFQSVDRPENKDFVRRFRARFGADRTTSDAIATAYNSVRLWAQAVRESETDEVRIVREALTRQSLNGPEGVISVERDTRHTWRPLFIGKVRSDGQVEILLSLTKPIRPTPFPPTRTQSEWLAFEEGLRAGWNGQWSPPRGRALKGP
jgi:urea transport system substrate-binding protein